MIQPRPITLEGRGIRLEPLQAGHHDALAAAAADGELWRLWFTSVFASQRAIESLGAKRDGILRHHAARRDGSARDSVIYSILAAQWPDVKRHLELRLTR